MIDLSYLRFAEPSGLVLICSEAERLAAQGHVDFTSPRNSEVANYLARMRLHEVLNELGISHGLPRVRENGVGLGLLEIRRFSSTDAASKLAEHVHANLVSQNGDIAAAVYVGICEAGENVFRHSESSRGYAVAQTTHQGRSLRFAVADAGVGVLATLRNRGAETDSDALELAMQEGISSYDDAGSGYGLSNLAGSLAKVRGGLTLLSGGASRRHVGSQIHRGASMASIPGAILEGSALL
ncbi:hypothetical protein GSU69_02785 [Rathayibacter festucae]|uniref:Histidine kinase/HSP90-like ATPase domain-containing protein n=1 Tax=Rathayibacter festucae TaxID=110937 RepID=A0ABX6GW25_9MICO|nr:hypothetical protein [Rathayibacter festucae]QHC61726.1 hypothetical protein GSU69_02785 [Rathayibacter festucae]